jgi:HAE1 family hydrophobic/amphiphilic exporter-1
MKHISTYLKNLKFEKRLSETIVAKYLLNLRLIILITLGIVIFGSLSFLNLPRNLYPDINIPMVMVTTVLPGANPNDVESLVTIPLEDSINGLSRVKNVQSSSLESVSSITVEFETGVDPEKAKSDVQSAIDSVSLPDDSQKPKAMKLDLQKTPIWTFNLTGSEDRASLIRFARKLKQELTDLSYIDTVSVSGMDDQEIQIVVKPEAISSFNLNPQQLIGAVKSALNTFPAGNVTTSNSTFSLTVNPLVKDIEDIRDLKVNLNGQVVSLSDIADIQEKSKPDQYGEYISRNGKINPTIGFNVFRVTTVNIDTADKQAQKKIDELLKAENNRFKVETVINYSHEIVDQFNELQRDLVTTIILVAIVLFLFLGARQAFVALLATPLTFLISFIVMGLTGITLNFISAFALLLSLGLLVDDTIVVISAITAYHRSGKFTPAQTGLLVWKDFLLPITTTTITTVWAFLPILISAGIIGEFIKPIPVVVSTTLIGSFFVAMFITLPFIIFLLKPSFPRRVVILGRILFILITLILLFTLLPKNSLLLFQVLIFMVLLFVTYQIRKQILGKIKERFVVSSKTKKKISEYMEEGIISLQKVEFYYSRFIIKILNSKSARRKIIVMVVIFSIFSYLLVPFGFVKNEFFPKSNGNTVYLSVELPSGTNIVSTRDEGVRILKEIKNIPESEFSLLTLGSGYSPFGGGSSSQNNFLITVKLKDKQERKLNSSEIAEDLRTQFKNYNIGKLSVSEESGGPPTGADIQIKLFGPDLATLDLYANKVEAFLKKNPGATSVDKSIKQGTSKIVFIPDEQKLSQAGLTSDTAGFWLRLFATGIKIDNLKTDEDINLSEDITLRMGASSSKAEDISSINIPNVNGVIPLSSLGKLELQANPTLISREDGKRTISITASVKKGYTIPQVNSDLEKFANGPLDLPSGYSWTTGGANEENQQSVQTIYQAMMISIILIIITMILQFNSFRKALIVILVIPLSISGVFIIFALTQTALSFPALIGVLALFGIVVKNSILVVDKITANIKTGMEFTESIADAAASRLEPIALTSICAIVGLIPITISDPLWRGLGGAIIAGLTFSGTIMLIFIPVIYYVTFKPQVKKRK